MPEGMRVMEAAGSKHGIHFEWQEFDWSSARMSKANIRALVVFSMKALNMRWLRRSVFSRAAVPIVFSDTRLNSRKATKRNI